MLIDDVNHALPILARSMATGAIVGSRQGERTRERLFSHLEISRPLNREITLPGRKASLPAQIAETMWVLAGRNDIEWLSNYLPRAADFSDDGATWRAGYGPRIRGWVTSSEEGRADVTVDQLAHVVELLKTDPGTRRAVISLYDPAVDTAPGKDIACNNWLHFIARDGRLHLHVATRSNDLWWGWSGINQFEWSALLEVVAGLVGQKVGTVVYDVTSLHLYEKHWARADELARSGESTFVPRASTPRFNPGLLWTSVDGLDGVVRDWFEIEEELRGGMTYRDAQERISRYPEPMFRSWLRVVAWWWSQDSRYLEPLRGTALSEAARLSPMKAETRAARKMAARMREASATQKRLLQEQGARLDAFMQRPAPVEPPAKGSSFVAFADNLHREKGMVYGDSWKKRGEQMSIMANIGRKIDRLGVAGAGDTAADTVIDLTIYLIKYRLWLATEQQSAIPFGIGAVGMEQHNEFKQVAIGLQHVAGATTHPSAVERHTRELVRIFNDDLIPAVEGPDDDPDDKANLVNDMLTLAGPLAHRLWLTEQNATRSWKGYGE